MTVREIVSRIKAGETVPIDLDSRLAYDLEQDYQFIKNQANIMLENVQAVAQRDVPANLIWITPQ